MTRPLTSLRHGGAALLATALGAASAFADPIAVSTLPPGAINHAQAQVIAKVIQESSDLQTRVVSFKWPDGTRREETVEVRPGVLGYVMGRKD